MKDCPCIGLSVAVKDLLTAWNLGIILNFIVLSCTMTKKTILFCPRPLQHTQNAAARLIYNLPKFSHLTPLFCDFYWLPVATHIRFKKMVLAFKSVNGTAPVYLQTLVRPHAPGRALSTTKDSRLICSDFTSTLHSMTPSRIQRSSYISLNLGQTTQGQKYILLCCLHVATACFLSTQLNTTYICASPY